MNRTEFREKILKLLTTSIDNYSFEKSENSAVINVNTPEDWTIEIGLTNLYREHMLEPFTDTQLQKALHKRITQSHQISEPAGSRVLPWTEAEDRIFPLLMQKAKSEVGDFVYDDFDDDLITTLVIDYDNRYEYILSKHIEQWAIPRSKLMESALCNLHALTEDIEIEAYGGDNKYILVCGMDGYDATRLLLPPLIEKSIEILGSPFMAAIPNRNYLIMWSAENSDEYIDIMLKEIHDNYSTQPHPLTTSIYLVDENTIKAIK